MTLNKLLNDLIQRARERQSASQSGLWDCIDGADQRLERARVAVEEAFAKATQDQTQ